MIGEMMVRWRRTLAGRKEGRQVGKVRRRTAMQIKNNMTWAHENRLRQDAHTCIQTFTRAQTKHHCPVYHYYYSPSVRLRFLSVSECCIPASTLATVYCLGLIIKLKRLTHRPTHTQDNTHRLTQKMECTRFIPSILWTCEREKCFSCFFVCFLFFFWSHLVLQSFCVCLPRFIGAKTRLERGFYSLIQS